jgi:hypothetical protein
MRKSPFLGSLGVALSENVQSLPDFDHRSLRSVRERAQLTGMIYA